jgi:hypothetical protein
MGQIIPMPENKPENLEVVRPPFKRSAESERLYNYLSDQPEGFFISYQQINELIQEDPQKPTGYALVKGVRERLIKENSVVWFVRPKIGLQRATTTEILEISDGNLRSIKRKIVRSGEVVKTATDKYDELSTEAKTEFNFLMSALGTLKYFFNRDKQKQLKSTVNRVENVVDSKLVLQMFGEK